MKIAMATLYGNALITTWKDWMEDDDDYIRTSEVLEVEFIDRPKEEVVPKQIKQIDNKIKEAKAKFNERIDMLEEEKSKLLAITYDGEQE